MGWRKFFDVWGFIITVVSFIFGFYLFWTQTNALNDSIVSALIFAGLVLATWTVLRICYLAGKKE